MNILFITTRYGRGLGGKENFLWELAHGMAKRHKIKVVARVDNRALFWNSYKRFSYSQKRAEYHDGDVEVNIIGLSLVEKLWLLPVHKLHFYNATSGIAVWMFNRVFMRKLLPFVDWADLIHYDGTGMQLVGYAGVALAKRLSKPYIILPHAHIGRWGDGPIDIELYKNADMVITATEYEKKMMEQKGVAKERLTVIGGAPLLSSIYDADWFRRRYNIRKNMVLFIAKKTEAKGYYALRAAVPIVLKEIPDTSFVLIGYGIALPEEDGVVEIGFVDEFEKTSALAACDIFCMPSIAESFGIVFIEAWAMGKPVIGGDIPTLRELIGEGGLVTSQNPEEIADKILFLLRHKEIRLKMGIRGKKKAKEKYTWEKITEETGDIYKRFIKK